MQLRTVSATFFLACPIQKGNFPKLVYAVAKQDYGIYSIKVTWKKN